MAKFSINLKNLKVRINQVVFLNYCWFIFFRNLNFKKSFLFYKIFKSIFYFIHLIVFLYWSVFCRLFCCVFNFIFHLVFRWKIWFLICFSNYIYCLMIKIDFIIKNRLKFVVCFALIFFPITFIFSCWLRTFLFLNFFQFSWLF